MEILARARRGNILPCPFGYEPECRGLRKHPKKLSFCIVELFPDIKRVISSSRSPLVLIIQDHEGLLQRRRGDKGRHTKSKCLLPFPSPSGIDSCDAADLDSEDEQELREDASGNQTLSDNQTDPTLSRRALSSAKPIPQAESQG